MCNFKNHFIFHNIVLSKEVNWICEYTKASSRIFSINDIIVTEVPSTEFYELDFQGIFFLFLKINVCYRFGNRVYFKKNSTL